MKSFDVDAKQLIRNYIDSIEEFVRNYTRLHPNEIDGLLNEINDFVYLRSRELTVGDRVLYSDVLRAIEECGSPSEISEQYLDIDQIDSRDDPITEKGVFKPKTGLDEAKSEERPFEQKYNDTSVLVDTSSSSFAFIGNSYRLARGFGLYRAIFIAFITIELVGFLSHLPYVGLAASRIIPMRDFSEIGYDFCIALTIYITFLIIWECWIIDRWKAKLVREKRLDRHMDDNLIAWVSRISILLIFLKTSLLFVPAYVVFIPFWIILVLIVERSLNSELWQKTLSPGLVKLGILITNIERTGDDYSDFRFTFRDKYSRDELGVALIPLLMLFYSFLILPFVPLHDWFNVVGLFIFGMILILALIIYFRRKFPRIAGLDRSKIYYGESELIGWLVRLLALKTIIVASVPNINFFLNNSIFLQFLIIIVWIAIEISSNSLGGESTRSWLGNLLVQIGNSASVQVKLPIQEERRSPSQGHSSPVVPSRIEPSVQEQPTLSSVNQVEQLSHSQPQIIEKATVIRQKQSSWLFRITGAMLRAIIMSISMFVLTIYEVALIFAILLTNFTRYGSYVLPSFEFDLSFLTFLGYPEGYTQVIYSYTIHVWYALLLLGIQVFAIVLVEYYGIATKSSEGVVARLGRNLSRILIFTLFIGSIVRFTYYIDFYALLEIMVLSVFFVFNEVNAWKVRSERKNWQKIEEMKQFETKTDEQVSQTQPRMS